MRERTPEPWIGPRLEVIDWRTLVTPLMDDFLQKVSNGGDLSTDRLCEVVLCVRGVPELDDDPSPQVLHIAGYYWDLTDGDVSYFEGLRDSAPEWQVIDSKG